MWKLILLSVPGLPRSYWQLMEKYFSLSALLEVFWHKMSIMLWNCLFTSKLVFVTSTLFVGKITAKLITAKLCFRADVCYNSMGYCLSEFNEISVLLNYSTDNKAFVFPTNSTSFWNINKGVYNLRRLTSANLIWRKNCVYGL